MRLFVVCVEGVFAVGAIMAGVVGFLLPDIPSLLGWFILALGALSGGWMAFLGWDILHEGSQ